MVTVGTYFLSFTADDKLMFKALIEPNPYYYSFMFQVCYVSLQSGLSKRISTFN